MAKQTSKPSYFKRNGLTIFFMVIFVVTLVAQAYTGWLENNQEVTQEGGHAIPFKEYLSSGHFISATFENFQSEFLQMALYVLVTVGLRQRGSAESKPLDKEEDVDREPVPSPEAPWPVRKGGWILKLYSSSLTICFFLLFIVSWALHLYGSLMEHNEQQLLKNQPTDTVLSYLGGPNFWFQSFQNWQSEFISIVSIVFLTIYLRQKGSPESKPVDAPHMQTGK